MIIKNIRLKYFRNYGGLELEPDAHINVFLGDNGQGKTNILEAVSYVTNFKSFRTLQDAEAIKIGEEGFSIRGELVKQGNIGTEIRFKYLKGSGKHVRVNRKRVKKLTEYVGEFPAVIFSPELMMITQGPPAHRRRYIDFLISQIDRMYLNKLLDYGKILKQRNKILKESKQKNSDFYKALEPWTESLIGAGTAIIGKRQSYLRELEKKLADHIKYLSDNDCSVSVKQETGFSGNEEIENQLRKQLNRERKRELLFETTLVGPHRSEIIFEINGKDLRKFGSQGEHKTVLLALKLCELNMIKDKRKNIPVVLLDDMFSMLDFKRSVSFMEQMGKEGQLFITSVKNENTMKILKESQLQAKGSKTLQVHNGTVDEIIF